MEDQLSELRYRRLRGEKSTEMRLATLSEFAVAREESRGRLLQTFQRETVEARARNQALLRELEQVKRSTWMGGRREGSAMKLQEARGRYTKAVEEILPLWKRQQREEHHEQLFRIQRERELVQDRRDRAERARDEEEKLRSALESERRELMLTLALEQRDRIQCGAQMALLRAQGKAVEETLVEEVERLRAEAQRVVEAVAASSLSSDPLKERKVQRTSVDLNANESSSKASSADTTRLSILRRPVQAAAPQLTANPHLSVIPSSAASDTMKVSYKIDDFEAEKTSSESDVGVLPLPPFPLESLTSTKGDLDSSSPPMAAENTRISFSRPASASMSSATSEGIYESSTAQSAITTQQEVQSKTTMDPSVVPKLEDEEKMKGMSISQLAALVPAIFQAIESIGGKGSQSGVELGYTAALKTLPSASQVLAVIEAVESAKIFVREYEPFVLCGTIFTILRIHGDALLPRYLFDPSLAIASKQCFCFIFSVKYSME